MRYALIGCGRISRSHMRAALENGLEVAAVCDVRPERMDGLLAEFGLGDGRVKRYCDYMRMIEENGIELASIATESGLHAEIALGCIGRGVNVIIEKPIAMSMGDADAIVEAARANGVKACACHQNRFNVAVQRLRRAVEAGRFGRISHGSVHVRWSRDARYYAQAPWRGTWKDDGGALMNQCIHGIDLLRWMMGDEAETVYGMTGRRLHGGIEAEDVGIAVVRFAGGAIATVEGTTNVYPRNLEESLYIFGERGTAKLGGKSANSVDVWEFEDGCAEDARTLGYEEKTDGVYGNGHSPLFADMVSAIRDDRPPYVDARAGRRALELVLAIYKSQKTGMPVDLPLGDFSCAEMAGEFGA